MPTLSTAPIRSGAVAASAAMWPGPRADSSNTRKAVDSTARSAVYGWPSSLLNDSGGAITRSSPKPARSTEAIRSLVEVLPLEPVNPITVRPRCTSASTLCRASADSAASTPSASPTCSTGTERPGSARDPSTATAPAATAAPAKSWPSTRSPGSATNIAPGRSRRVSNSTPVTSTSAPTAGTATPITAAISPTVIAIMRWPPAVAASRRPSHVRPARRSPRRGRRTGGPPRRRPGPARGPCRR